MRSDIDDGRRPGGRRADGRVGWSRRLRPLYLATFLQSVALWVPIEKLFMTEIGFDNGSVAVMAAAYSAVVPLLEVPSGILADRWSRRGVAFVAQAALLVSVVLGGSSTNVARYVVAALFLGVYFAMQSGTFESVAYDVVVEETGDGSVFERAIGRIRFYESAGLVLGALAGGVLAELVPLRATYFLTAPFIVAAGAALWRFREPALHRAGTVEPLRRQVAATYRAVLERGVVRPIVVLLVLTALLLQATLEFGPLWLVALSAPAGLYGPHWAGLMAALGLGGLLGGHSAVLRPTLVVAGGGAVLACCVVLIASSVVGVVVVAQVLLVLLVVAVSIPLTGRLHDAVPSTIRAGVSSGVGTLTWLTFLPFALAFGAVSGRSGVHEAGWTLAAVAALTVLLLAGSVRHLKVRAAAGLMEPVVAPERFRADDDPTWPGHWVTPPTRWELREDEAAVAAAVAEVRDAIVDLPRPYHEVIVARDVAGRPPAQVRADLDLSPDDERALLHRARAAVYARLEGRVEGRAG